MKNLELKDNSIYLPLGNIFPDKDVDRFSELIVSRNHSGIKQWFDNCSLQESYQYFNSISEKLKISLLSLLPPSLYREIEILEAMSAPVIEMASPVVPVSFCADDKVVDVLRYFRMNRDARKNVVFVLNDDKQYEGVVTLNGLMMADEQQSLSDILEPSLSCEASLDCKKAVSMLLKQDVDYLVVVNSVGQPAAILEYRDAVAIRLQGQSEGEALLRGERQGGSDLRGYLETSVLAHVRGRILWIIGLAAVGIISGMIIQSYEDAIAALTILALYLPMVADTGGNAGSQAATVVVRALALGNVKTSDWLVVVWKEFRVSLLIGLGLAVATMAKVTLLSYGVELPMGLTLGQLGFAIAISLFFQVVSSTVIGASLPILAKYCNKDPAVVASPAITTIVDISGMLIYFYCTTVLLGLA
ncbi:magnesium transporter [Sinobacterium caligoides]|uniref:Magnesium transporter n=1 Tax=Sinobacterium caligoides TaxID=933926 RepID=A0A3N2DN21_9GAMM|nr:magnesium transporter [Sinobacterium caligoides]ROS01208.1 magnesium transporter [Sinobacterium caligoides]